ncbi:hypothetical protein [Dactylosporangium sp. NPDC051541]|uniref:hypothetical protein n=1 Tax=Dactylosporangium sp. NPDC051541 TaxID=3363977 RepID=UPI0037B4C592
MTPQPPRRHGQFVTPYTYPSVSAVDREKAGLFRAGKVALWVWIGLTAAPILLLGLCLLNCVTGMFGLAHAVNATTSSSP